jgi:hypothetical protein
MPNALPITLDLIGQAQAVNLKVEFAALKQQALLQQLGWFGTSGHR